MTTIRKALIVGVGACLAAVAGFVPLFNYTIPAAAQNTTNPNGIVAPFDFSDCFYQENGIQAATPSDNCPAGFSAVPPLDTTGGRVGIPGNSGAFGFPTSKIPPNNNGEGHWIADTTNTDPVRANTRVLQTTGGFDNGGNHWPEREDS